MSVEQTSSCRRSAISRAILSSLSRNFSSSRRSCSSLSRGATAAPFADDKPSGRMVESRPFVERESFSVRLRETMVVRRQSKGTHQATEC